jgi:hypothetical protein
VYSCACSEVFPSRAPCWHKIPGAFSGTLSGDDGVLIAGVVVANGSGVAARGRGVSAANGAFSIPNLPAGTYFLYGRPRGRGYLDPCVWSPDPPKVSVTAGKATANVKLVLPKGAVIDVRVNDPSTILGATALPNAVAPHVLLHTLTPRGLIEPLVSAGKNATGVDYQTTVPFSAPVRISVSGKQLQILDSTGQTLNPAGSSFLVQQASGSPSTTVTLQVKP